MIFFKQDTPLPTFIPLPKFMVEGEYSVNAKLLYGLLLHRTTLSQKSGWMTEDGNVYVIYTIRQMSEALNRSERTVKTALHELENAGLLVRVRQGWNKANMIYLKIPENEVQKTSHPLGKIYPMEVQKSSPCMGQNLPTSNTDKEYIDMSKNKVSEDDRTAYGKFHNVFLSKDELSELQAELPDKWEYYIDRLSSHIASKGAKYQSHAATIYMWSQEDRAKTNMGNSIPEYVRKEGESL